MNGDYEPEMRILEKRAHIQDVYAQVRLDYPSLPPLRDFQVASIPHKSQHGQFQADIIGSAADNEDASHILSCLPTGYGKSLPMLLLSLFLPQGIRVSVVIDFWYIHTDACTRCVIDSLLKCENSENLIWSDTEPGGAQNPG